MFLIILFHSLQLLSLTHTYLSFISRRFRSWLNKIHGNSIAKICGFTVWETFDCDRVPLIKDVDWTRYGLEVICDVAFDAARDPRKSNVSTYVKFEAR